MGDIGFRVHEVGQRHLKMGGEHCLELRGCSVAQVIIYIIERSIRQQNRC